MPRSVSGGARGKRPVEPEATPGTGAAGEAGVDAAAVAENTEGAPPPPKRARSSAGAGSSSSSSSSSSKPKGRSSNKGGGRGASQAAAPSHRPDCIKLSAALQRVGGPGSLRHLMRLINRTGAKNPKFIKDLKQQSVLDRITAAAKGYRKADDLLLANLKLRRAGKQSPALTNAESLLLSWYERVQAASEPTPPTPPLSLLPPPRTLILTLLRPRDQEFGACPTVRSPSRYTHARRSR